MSWREHWERIYTSTAATPFSWYQAVPARSLDLVARTGLPLSAPILDVGGGDSTLVDHLLLRGHGDITVLDVSRAALERAQRRLGDRAALVKWVEGDVTRLALPPASVGVWHDRAAFHFLTSVEEQLAYVRQVRRVVRPLGHVIVATFAEDGPARCSGLPVVRYSAEELHGTFGTGFRLVASEREVHVTPAGVEQRFTYCWCVYETAAIDVPPVMEEQLAAK